MLQREPVNLPQHVYPLDPWRIVEKKLSLPLLQQTESIFTVANGYLGIRGCHEEGSPCFESGTFINGFYETWPIVYPEGAYGLAEEGQTIVNVTDAKLIRLFVDDEPFSVDEADLVSFERVLDMKTGTLDRDLVWRMGSGKHVRIRSRRLVSYEYRHLAAISYEVTVLDADASVFISSRMENNRERRLRSGDPRLHHLFKKQVLAPIGHRHQERRVLLGHKTEGSRLTLVCGMDHSLETAQPWSLETHCSEHEASVGFSCRAEPGVAIRLTKYVAYSTSAGEGFEGVAATVERILDRANAAGFPDLLDAQQRHLDDFWDRSNVHLEGSPELQQALRFNLFQIFQAACCIDEQGIPAKGLTSQSYDGHYFWDDEIYVLPFLAHVYPHLAKNVLEFRYRTLDQARERAQIVGEKGALFPWRTIDGREASSNYAAGTAQYHIDGDISYALQHYVEATGDTDFLFEKGAEILAETARMWCSLGFFSDRRDGQFCIHGVTGPDEYNTVVNNNVYTNLIAQNNLSYAAATLTTLKKERPELHAKLTKKIGLRAKEVREWREAASRMYLPYDEELGINPQDDGFLDKKVWDFEKTPADRFPLLLHYHPLVIYRQQVLKQADIALAMVLLGDRFSLEQKRRNFDYYDPLTTGDSSLSVCIEAILALEVGYAEKAFEYAKYAVLMDLSDLQGNVKDGCHIASLGGSWMLCVYGFAGMREQKGRLSFDPRLPAGLTRLAFPLRWRDRVLEVEIEAHTATYRLREGDTLHFHHRDEKLSIAAGEAVTRAMGAPLDRSGAGQDSGS